MTAEPALEPASEPPVPDTSPAESEEFAQLLAASEADQARDPEVGDKVTGTIIQIDEGEAFVDCGARSELAIATAELKDDQGVLQYQVGDNLTAHVQAVDGEKQLTLSLVLRDSNLEALQQAYRDGTPLSGTVKETNKGGFTVDLSGRRAFCPFSQIDLRRATEPEAFVGQTYSFRIIELAEDGRNIVVSRRSLLQEEREQLATQTRDSLELGNVHDGVVTRLAPFGAFVDIGGIEGLVHISQISHQRIPDPSSVLQVGQQVKVKVLEIQNLGQGRKERISLSIKALSEDPWPATARQLQIGSDVTGRVTRLVDFGAFIELQPGVEGLVHISELAPHRIYHPQEVVEVDEEVTVRILDVDLDRRRISLSLKETRSSLAED
jgi:small subunit ribosomal protein S1